MPCSADARKPAWPVVLAGAFFAGWPVLLAAGCVSLVAAVDRAAAQNTFAAFGLKPSGRAVLYELSADGRLLSTIGVLPAGRAPHAVVMSSDNRRLRVSTAPSLRYGFGAILDVTPSGVVTTMAAGRPLFWPTATIDGSDGETLVLDVGLGRDRLDLIELRGGSIIRRHAVTTHAARAAVGDVATGALVVNAARNAPAEAGYYTLDPARGTLVRRAAGEGLGYPSTGELLYDAASGSVFDIVFDRLSTATQLVRVHPTAGVVRVGAPIRNSLPVNLAEVGPRGGPVAFVALVRSLGSFTADRLLWLAADGSVLRSIPIRGVRLSPASSWLRIGRRHLAWSVERPPHGRALRVSFPHLPGRAYAVVFGMSGVRPGVRLRDGRHVPLNLDALSALSLRGGAGTVLAGTVGFLDRAGSAKVTVDTNRFGTALRGAVAWAVAVVLDPRRPGGVARIAGPTRLDVRI